MTTAAFIIHVPGDRRRERNVRRLRSYLIDAGVTDVHVFDGVVPDDAGPLRTLGEWGCYRSHVGALRAGLAIGTDEVMVLEDDAVPVLTPGELATFLAAARPEAWDSCTSDIRR